MHDIGAPVMEVIYWTLGGVVVGALGGWQFRIMYEARDAAKKAAATSKHLEDLLEQNLEWDGTERRGSPAHVKHYNDSGVSQINVIITLMIVMAFVAASLGVMVSIRTAQQTECFTRVNEAFAKTIEARAVASGELSREAADIDRAALDALISKVTQSVREPNEATDLEPAFLQYRETRRESDLIRSEATTILENNPFPSSEICRR